MEEGVVRIPDEGWLLLWPSWPEAVAVAAAVWLLAAPPEAGREVKATDADADPPE